MTSYLHDVKVLTPFYGVQRAKRKAAEPPTAGPHSVACQTDIQQYRSAIEALQPSQGAQASHGAPGSRLADILT